MYIVEIVLPSNEVSINSHKKYPISASSTNVFNKKSKFCIKKYTLNTFQEVINIQIDIKTGNLIGTIVLISHNNKIIIQDKVSLEEESEDECILEDYTSDSSSVGNSKRHTGQ